MAARAFTGSLLGRQQVGYELKEKAFHLLTFIFLAVAKRRSSCSFAAFRRA
ncbi:protein of unknown function [Shewanella benthica]|uniref:Uncharacterized protein n=1 Tax=Shewanella benthica TaxID=43661 RepID=A0A330M863_9GAMM|nr:protein of unknown function [Shewanella benthica]